MVFRDCLFAVGLIGTSRPFFPVPLSFSPLQSSIGSCSAPNKSIGWNTIVVLVLLTLATYGSILWLLFRRKIFRRNQMGRIGAIVGALVGLFFGLIGLFVGPVIGAIVGEVIAGKRVIDAGRAGWEVCSGTSARCSPS